MRIPNIANVALAHAVAVALVVAASFTSLPVRAAPEKLAADTPKTTVLGNTFFAPKDWTITVKGPATILEAPEGGSYVALVDVKVKDAKDSDAAVKAAWAAVKPDASWPLLTTTPGADRDGWTERKSYGYQTSPNEKRNVGVDVRKANDVWTVAIFNMAEDVGEKRGSQIGVIFGKLLPKGYSRESFAGKKAATLDEKHIAALTKFVETSMALTKVPGVSLALYQDNKVVFSGGFGERELGKKNKPDGDTKYMIASNTKAMATLMLAKLVDDKKIGWDDQAVKVMPQFKLGDDATTQSVLVKHLICACTGMPRQDMEWLLEYGAATPDSALKSLGTMKPTSKFGELFQYSNLMAAAAGYLGGHVVYPKLELGAAYDKAMQTLVFDPLQMKTTTLDFKAAEKGNWAQAHSPDIDGTPAAAEASINHSIIAVRPAGGAWSSVNDVMKYVAMELHDGKLADGKPYIGKDALYARRAPQVAVGTDVTYGMGLFVDKSYDVTVVHHGGDMIGFHSDMMWLPELGVGAVILTNGDPGWLIRGMFRRKLLEVLFDGKSEADGAIAAQAKSFFDEMAAQRKLYQVPADKDASGKLAAKYQNDALGTIEVKQQSGLTRFNFGEWSSEVASKKNPDGTTSFVTIVPGFEGLELVVGGADKVRTLTLRDAQHEYVFNEVK